MENFDPHDPKYKSVEDLPEEYRGKYEDVKGGGFITREAYLNDAYAEGDAKTESSVLPEFLGGKKVTKEKFLMEEAKEMNESFDLKKQQHDFISNLPEDIKEKLVALLVAFYKQNERNYYRERYLQGGEKKRQKRWLRVCLSILNLRKKN